MTRISSLTAAIALSGVLLTAPAAQADKKSDSLRIAFHDPISMIDIIYDPKPETQFTSNLVFDTLLYFDDWKQEFKPLLAESWKRIDAKTWEFKLRQDVKFHDGSAFDADDVVYTINWVANPKVRFRIKSRFLWIAGADKIDQYTVRVRTKRPAAGGLMRLAKSTPIFPSDVHGALKRKSAFGKKPVGTGPYRATQVDPNKGIVVVRNAAYRHGGDAKPAGRIERIEIRHIPDVQTQIAELLTGRLDMVHGVPKDQTDALTADPRFEVTYSPGLFIYYISIDAAGRSGKAELRNIKVRKAIMHAVNRTAIRENLIPGGAKAPVADALCFRFQRGCDFTTKPPAFDPAAAKKLLAEAGLANGFPVVLTSTAPREIVEAIAGNLRAVGIEASVDKLTFGAYRKKQRAGKIQILVNPWSSGGLADVESTVGFFFAKSARNSTGDPELTRLARGVSSSFDEAKRRAISRTLFDRVNQQHYIMPVTARPTAFLHAKGLEIKTGALDTFGAYGFRMRWK